MRILRMVTNNSNTMMKNTNYKKIIGIILFMILLFSAVSVCALDYIPLEPNAFPGVTKSTSLGAYLGVVFNLGVAIAVVLALVMIIWGGIMYMTTDSWEGKNDGKSKITNALWGLGLALVSWLLLYTINPALVDFKNNTLLNPPSSSVSNNNASATNIGGGGNSGGNGVGGSY